MRSRVFVVLLSALLLASCRSPYDYKLPADVEKLESDEGLKQALTKLPKDEKMLVARYILRAALANAFAQDVPDRTVRQAIEEQRRFETERAQKR